MINKMETKRTILLISGYIGSGKDTIANYLVKNNGWYRIGIADTLKDYISKIYNIDRKLLDTQEGKKTIYKDNITYRDLLINVGCSHREQDEDFWINKVIDIIKNKDLNKIVIPDLRFINEYIKIKNTFENNGYNIYTLRVIRPNNCYEKINDISETSMDNFKFDYIINNDNSLDILYENIKSIILHHQFF